MRAQVEIGTGGGKRTVGPESLAPKVAEMGRGDAGDGVWGCCSPLRRRRILQVSASQHSRSLVPIMAIMFKSS